MLRRTRQTKLPFNLRKRPQQHPNKQTDLHATTNKSTQLKLKHKKAVKRPLTPAQQQLLDEEKQRREVRAAERDRERAARDALRRAEDEQQQRAIDQHRRLIELAFDLEQLDDVLVQLIDEGVGVADSDDEMNVERQPQRQAGDECDDQQMGDSREQQPTEDQSHPTSPIPPLALPSPASSSASSISSEDSGSSATVSPVSEQLDSDDEPSTSSTTRYVSSASSSTTSLSSTSYSSALCRSGSTAAFELDFDLQLDWPYVIQRDLYYKVAYTPLLPATPFALPAEYDADRKLICRDTEPSFTLIERNEWKRKKPAVKRQDREDEQDSVTRCNCHLKLSDDEPQQQDEKAESEDDGAAAAGKVYNCGDGCLNATLFAECDDNSCMLTSLHASSRCNNRNFTRHTGIDGDPVPVEKCWYDVKGWGLRATADVAAGVFLIEYLGEVINNKECKRRIDKEDRRAERSRKRTLVSAREQNRGKSKKAKTSAAQEGNSAGGAGDVDNGAPRSNYYFMAVVDDVVLDASSKGSIARFINHSCDANCVIQKWTVGDELRIGIFTQRPVRRGEELTIDYKYDRIGLHYQPCYCGSHNCAQWIGAKRTNGALDGKQRLKLSKKGRKQADAAARARAEQNADEVCGGCGIGGELVLCDHKLPTGHYCPRAHHVDCAELASLEGEIMCAWHICDRVDPSVCRKRAQLFCVCCSSSRCTECDAADKEWAMPWRESQLCLQRVMRLEGRDWLCSQAEGREELWVVCRDCQTQPRVLMRDELAIWKAITGQAHTDDRDDGDTTETERAMNEEDGHGPAGEDKQQEQPERKQAGVVAEQEVLAMSALLVDALTYA